MARLRNPHGGEHRVADHGHLSFWPAPEATDGSQAESADLSACCGGCRCEIVIESIEVEIVLNSIDFEIDRAGSRSQSISNTIKTKMMS